VIKAQYKKIRKIEYEKSFPKREVSWKLRLERR
jgi:hypothetical protein